MVNKLDSIQINTPASIYNQKDQKKKKRVGKACDSCRIKKTKCNGKKPCNKCIVENRICAFTEKKRDKEKTYPPGYVELIQTRSELLTKSLYKLIDLSLKGNDMKQFFLEKHKVVELNNQQTSWISINKVINVLIQEENLLEGDPIQWYEGSKIAANLDSDDDSVSKAVSAYQEHNRALSKSPTDKNPDVYVKQEEDNFKLTGGNYSPSGPSSPDSEMSDNLMEKPITSSASSEDILSRNYSKATSDQPAFTKNLTDDVGSKFLAAALSGEFSMLDFESETPTSSGPGSLFEQSSNNNTLPFSFFEDKNQIKSELNNWISPEVPEEKYSPNSRYQNNLPLSNVPLFNKSFSNELASPISSPIFPSLANEVQSSNGSAANAHKLPSKSSEGHIFKPANQYHPLNSHCNHLNSKTHGKRTHYNDPSEPYKRMSETVGPYLDGDFQTEGDFTKVVSEIINLNDE